jgi:outer membrane receptor protein involved in Fe transport
MNHRQLLSGVAAAALSAALVTAAPPAFAQAAADGAQLEEVIVTAQRRSENLQNTPVSVQAVSAEQIQERAVSNLLELQRVAPSLTVQDTASNVSPFIRGVGTTLTGAGQAASVATYVDGVYIATLTSAAFDLDTAEQVQVLSGPQGALYGRNATGGAIVVTTHTPKPGDPFRGSARVTLGNYDTRTVSGHLSGSLGEQVAGYLAGSLRKHDGYIDNLNPPGAGAHHEDLNDRDAWNIQGALTFAPTDRFSLVLRGSHFEAKDRLGVGLQTVGLDIPVAGGLNGTQAYYAGLLQSLGLPPAAAGAAAAGLRFSTRIGETYDNEANGFSRGILKGDFLPGSFVALKVDAASLRAAYRGESFEISSLTSYSKAKSYSATEIILADPTSYPAGFQGGSVGFSGDFPSRNFQEDFQITSVDTPIRYVAGVFYFNGKGDTDLTGDLPPLSARTAFNTWRSKSLAGYAQVTAPLSDTWSVTGGARYTDEKYNVVDRIGPTTPGNAFGIPNLGTKRQNSSKATYTARIEYDNGPLLGYAGISTGFKGATLSPVNLGSPGVDPEEITSYEAGFKWDVASTLRLNASLFHYTYDNIHIAYTDTTTGSNILVNGTGAKLTGLEFQGLLRATPWLTLRASGLLLDSEYDDDVRSAGSVAVLRTKGNRLAGAPKAVISAGGDVVVPDVAGGQVKLSVDILHNDGYWFDAENLIGTGGASAKSYTTVDVNLSYRPKGGRWKAALFGTNVFDDKYFQSGIAASGVLRSAAAATPALYGVDLSLDF